MDGWDRVAEPSERLVHFAGPGLLGNATLCGITDWLGRPVGDGAVTRQRVNCSGCLAVVAFVLDRGSPPERRYAAR